MEVNKHGIVTAWGSDALVESARDTARSIPPSYCTSYFNCIVPAIVSRFYIHL